VAADARAVCWCGVESNATGKSCETIEEFRIQVGVMELRGPHPNQKFTCSVRSPCQIAPIRGVGLENGFRVLLTPRTSCDKVDFSQPTLVGGSAVWDLVTDAAGSCGSYKTGCKVLLSAENMTALPPVDYRLCWCGDANCDTETDFLTELGRLRVKDGPRQQFSRGVNARASFS